MSGFARGSVAGSALLRWGGAFAIVSAVHAAVVWVTLSRVAPETEAHGSSPVLMIELAPLAVAPTSPSPEISSAASPSEPEPLPAPSPPEPELQLPLPEIPSPVVLPTKPQVRAPSPQFEEREKVQKKPEPPKRRKDNPKPTDAAPASVAAPASEARAETSAASAPGVSSPSSAIASWGGLVRGHIGRFATSSRLSGSRARTVGLDVSIDRRGRIMNAQITRSSGDQTFDGEVLLMLQRASPVPAPPIEVKGEIVNLSTPFTFKP